MIMTKLSVCLVPLANEDANHGTNTSQENRHPSFHQTRELEAISYRDTIFVPNVPAGK